MSFWLKVDDSREDGFSGEANNLYPESVDREFNFTHGLAPMEENVFYYMVARILNEMFYGCRDYVCVGYEPPRHDRLSAVQANRPQIDEGINVEIVFESDNKRGFQSFCKKDATIEETIEVFRNVLVQYSCPDLNGWEDITDLVRTLDD